jgi:hypothetical protein
MVIDRMENESLLVFARNNSGAVRVVGMTEYLKEGKRGEASARGDYFAKGL